MLLLLGRTSGEVFVVDVLDFIFISFLIFILLSFVDVLHFLSSFVDVLHSYFCFFNVMPRPSVDYHRVFTPILYFQSSPSQSDSQHFHFQPFRYLLTTSATILSVRFLPTGVFYLMLLHRHF